MSRKKAIEDKCKDCTYDPLAPGTWRQQCELCAVTVCALHRYRPVSSRPLPDALLKAYGLDNDDKTP